MSTETTDKPESKEITLVKNGHKVTTDIPREIVDLKARGYIDAKDLESTVGTEPAALAEPAEVAATKADDQASAEVKSSAVAAEPKVAPKTTKK